MRKRKIRPKIGHCREKKSRLRFSTEPGNNHINEKTKTVRLQRYNFFYLCIVFYSLIVSPTLVLDRPAWIRPGGAFICFPPLSR